jgi:Fe-S oxidoreductase
MIDVRRNEVLMQGRVPDEAARMLKTLENQGNPFGAQADRIEWIEGMNIRVVDAGDEVDVLYWSGCYTGFDSTKRQIAQDLCTLLGSCGIDYGVLGPDERCCGDPARIVADERLFQETAKAQVEQLNKRKFRVLLTSCPHCYNVLANEYPQFGGHFNVVHHSEFIRELLRSNKLKPEIGEARKLVYHDPCFLGR